MIMTPMLMNDDVDDGDHDDDEIIERTANTPDDAWW